MAVTTRPDSDPKRPAVQVEKLLETLLLLPLHAQAEAHGRSVPSQIRHLTGLSKARISQGQLDRLQPWTVLKIEAHQQRLLAAAAENAEDLASRQSWANASPRLKSGQVATWALWMHQWEYRPTLPLPISKAVALILDELLVALLAACKVSDLKAFKRLLKQHLKHHGLMVRLGGKPTEWPVDAAVQAELKRASTWQQLAQFTSKLVDNLYLDLIATLDAEWNLYYFGGLNIPPVFPLVMVRPQPGVLEAQAPKTKRNWIHRPVKRLLEFMYALAFYRRHQRWPADAPSPKTLANILCRPDEDAMAAPSLISNYFDGSTRLTLDLATTYWQQLIHHFRSPRNQGQTVGSPMPMVALAIQWQTLLVRDKGKSFYVLDLAQYQQLWHTRRQQCASRLAADGGSTRSTSAERSTLVWPAWTGARPASCT